MKTRDIASTEPMTLAFEVNVTSVQELSPNFRRVSAGAPVHSPTGRLPM